MTNSESNKRIAKNTAMLYLRMFFTLAVSLYISRVILHVLGITDYGIYNVVGGIVIMLGFLNNAMAASTQRFLTYEMGKSDLIRVNRVFSMSVTIHIIIAIIVLILSETAGLWFLNSQLKIPAARMEAANWVYQFSIFTFIIAILNVPYNAVIIANERMNVYAYISILEMALKLCAVFVLVWFDVDKLKFYAVLLFAVSLVIRMFEIAYCKRKFEESIYHFFWDKPLFQQMVNFANWNLLGVFAGIASGQGVNMILNIFFGPVINAARGIAYQVQGAVNGFVTNFQVAVNPPITKSYALGEKQYMYSLIFSASKYSFYLLLLLSLPILIETRFILTLWLKNFPDYTIIFTQLILIEVLIYSLSGSLQTMAQATGKVKRYQLVVSGIILFNLPVSFVLLLLHFPPQSTFIAAIIISFIALLGRLFVLNLMEHFPVREFFREVILRVTTVIIAATILPYFISSHLSYSIMRFVIVLLISILSVFTTVYFLGVTKSERENILFFLVKFISRKSN